MDLAAAYGLTAPRPIAASPCVWISQRWLMKISKWTPTLFACALASIGAPALASTAPNAAQSPPVPVLNWTPCGAAFPGAECAVATVPLDYDQPRGATTTIALAKIPA